MSASGDKGKAIETPETNEGSTKSLATQVMQLASLVKQNTRLLIQHGEDIMRIDASRMGISSTDGSTLSSGPGDDVIQDLVTELQVKLDELEERSIRRTANSAASESDDEIEWMPSPDSDTPEPPKTTLAAFNDITREDLLTHMKLYGLAHYEDGMPLPDEEEYAILFNDCARFLGVRSRKKVAK